MPQPSQEARKTTVNELSILRDVFMKGKKIIYLSEDLGSSISEKTDDLVRIDCGGHTGIKMVESSTEIDVSIGVGNVLATNANVGYLYIPSMAGDATGTPGGSNGKIPIAWDTTNQELKVFAGGAWRVITSAAQ